MILKPPFYSTFETHAHDLHTAGLQSTLVAWLDDVSRVCDRRHKVMPDASNR